MDEFKKKNKKRNRFLEDVSIGSFLAYRQVRRSSIATTILIIFVMTLTFLNLVVVSGILVGLIEGAVAQVKTIYISDVAISPLKNKDVIENSPQIMKMIRNLPWTEAVTGRYLTTGKVEANYKSKTKLTDKTDQVTTVISGIDPADEDAVTTISDYVIEGQYLERTDVDEVLVGSMLLKKYFPIESRGFETLSEVNVGDKIRITINGNVREVRVKGIVKSKVDEISRRIFFTETQLRGLLGQNDLNLAEIAIKVKNQYPSELLRNALLASGVGDYGKVQTFEEAMPKFLKDMIATFAILGNTISSIGLVVASITIFIVIYINAITRRKFIGILKGIGIESSVIKTAYVMQAVFYALIGTAIGALILYGLLKPYIDANPIDFPFSDGILVAPLTGTLIRTGLLLLATIIAGYIPARLVVRQNTLDAILGR